MKTVYLRFQENLYAFVHKVIGIFKPILKPQSLGERLVIPFERVAKELVYNCQMCGQCILHSTGMVCSMNCPKNLRNGPCGGVRLNGHCEVKPEMQCVWVRAYENAMLMNIYGSEMMWVQPPVNREISDTSAWVNMLHGLDQNQAIVWQSKEQADYLESLWR